jgi:hypothetical protein
VPVSQWKRTWLHPMTPWIYSKKRWGDQKPYFTRKHRAAKDHRTSQLMWRITSGKGGTSAASNNTCTHTHSSLLSYCLQESFPSLRGFRSQPQTVCGVTHL